MQDFTKELRRQSDGFRSVNNVESTHARLVAEHGCLSCHMVIIYMTKHVNCRYMKYAFIYKSNKRRTVSLPTREIQEYMARGKQTWLFV